MVSTQSDKPSNANEYIAGFPQETQKLLRQLRTAILKAAPGAEEVISYQMPAFKHHGMLVWFAGYKNHIGLYPGANGIAAFKEEIAVYKHAKGSVQFPLDQPLPLELVKRIVEFKLNINLEKAGLKKEKKKQV